MKRSCNGAISWSDVENECTKPAMAMMWLPDQFRQVQLFLTKIKMSVCQASMPVPF